MNTLCIFLERGSYREYGSDRRKKQSKTWWQDDQQCEIVLRMNIHERLWRVEKKKRNIFVENMGHVRHAYKIGRINREKICTITFSWLLLLFWRKVGKAVVLFSSTHPHRHQNSLWEENKRRGLCHKIYNE